MSVRGALKAAAAAVLAGLVLSPAIAGRAADAEAPSTSITVPGGEKGIGFDDLSFSPSLHKVLVPAGRTGTLAIIDPQTKQLDTIGGFASSESFAGGHGEGITSVDEGKGVLFVTDRTAKRLDVVDPAKKSIIASAELSSGPDYVRYVAETNEVWVTEPRARGIEVFSLPASGTPKPAHSGFIEVPGGPESLVVDHKRHQAYANLWTDTTVAIDLDGHKLTARWPNGCKGSRGLALDDDRGLLFVGCEEGKLQVLSLPSGKVAGSGASGDGVDIIAYNPKLAHAYLPGAKSATMAIIGIPSAGTPAVLKTVKTARGAHCAVSDDSDGVYVCDPVAGKIIAITDDAPASK
jgi:DNA-binding beta-propeller fold protein YncE